MPFSVLAFIAAARNGIGKRTGRGNFETVGLASGQRFTRQADYPERFTIFTPRQSNAEVVGENAADE
jgi:hypothetical protein